MAGAPNVTTSPCIRSTGCKEREAEKSEVGHRAEGYR